MGGCSTDECRWGLEYKWETGDMSDGGGLAFEAVVWAGKVRIRTKLCSASDTHSRGFCFVPLVL